jgi:hypothetical protein
LKNFRNPILEELQTRDQICEEGANAQGGAWADVVGVARALVAMTQEAKCTDDSRGSARRFVLGEVVE